MNFKDNSRKLTGFLLAIFGIIFLLYFLIWTTGVLLWSFDIAVLFILLFGILLLFKGIMLLRNKKSLLGRYKFLAKSVLFFSVIFLVSFTIIEGFIIYNSLHNDNSIKADFVLIPGAEVVDDRPSRVLMQRLQRTLSYIEENPNTLIIVSGAQGTSETYSEAEVMKNFLIKNGIHENSIIKDEKATNSFQNIKYSKEIMDRTNNNHYSKLMIITNEYHIFRMKIIAKNQGIEAYAISVPVHYSVIPICYIREYFSMLKILIQMYL